MQQRSVLLPTFLPVPDIFSERVAVLGKTYKGRFVQEVQMLWSIWNLGFQASWRRRGGGLFSVVGWVMKGSDGRGLAPCRGVATQRQCKYLRPLVVAVGSAARETLFLEGCDQLIPCCSLLQNALAGFSASGLLLDLLLLACPHP